MMPGSKGHAFHACMRKHGFRIMKGDFMEYYLAPMEGITTYVYRRAYHACFAPMDKYFTPFLVPHTKKGLTAKEINEILPEHNAGMYLVPQILTNDAEGFVQTVEKLKNYGYREVNLNLGCPSRTVASKFRGSGFLAKPEELDRFLREIFDRADIDISIKTRIGRDEPEEFERLLEIYNQYPLKELIIHPRVQQDYYNNCPNLAVFGAGLSESRCPVCYNGDIFTVEDFRRLVGRFPDIQTVMLGRGIIGDPFLVEQAKKDGEREEEICAKPGEQLKAFHDKVLADYMEINFGDKNVLFKMKEIWCYLGKQFEGSEKLLKKIRKEQRVREHAEAANELFALLS